MNTSNAVITYGASRASKFLAEGAARHLGIDAVPIGAGEHPDRSTYIATEHNFRGQKVIFMGSSPDPDEHLKPNDAIMEYLFAADLLSRCKPESFYFVIPYLPYAREDRTKGERIALTSKCAVDTIMRIPSKGVILVEPHTEYLEQAFPLGHPPDIVWLTNLMAFNFAHAVKTARIDESRLQVLGVDHGTKVRVLQTVKLLQKHDIAMSDDYSLAEKNRKNAESVEFMSFLSGGSLNRTFLLAPDDIMASGSTAIGPARAAKKAGASVVFAYASHATLTLDDSKRPKILAELDKPDSALDGLILSNTLKIPDSIRRHPKVWVLDSSEYLALAIHNSFGIPMPGVEDHQGSLRGLNKGLNQAPMTPQPMPPVLMQSLLAKLDGLIIP